MDVNVLVYAANRDGPDYTTYRDWLNRTSSCQEPFGVSELVISGVVRVLTSLKGFPAPITTDEAFAFVESLRSRPNCVLLRPGSRHWSIFADLCSKTNARGNTVPDAYHAALAIENGCEWVTADRGFARFPGLRWRHPLDD